MNWDKATDIILYTAILLVAILGVMGLYQWITRRSFMKIDKPLLALIAPLALIVITYFVFDKFLILNTRPDGSGEPSFPSTHIMIVSTVFFCTAILLPYYVKNKPIQIFLDLAMLAFIVLVSVGRVLAHKHWTSDVIAGLIFAALFTGIYYFTVKKLQKSQNSRKAIKKEAQNG